MLWVFAVVFAVDHFWLVFWNMNFRTFHISGMSSSQLTNSYFSDGVGIPPTSKVCLDSILGSFVRRFYGRK